MSADATEIRLEAGVARMIAIRVSTQQVIDAVTSAIELDAAATKLAILTGHKPKDILSWARDISKRTALTPKQIIDANIERIARDNYWRLSNQQSKSTR